MSMLYEGRVSCFSPKTYLNKANITIIRPMIYIDEIAIKSMIKRYDLPIIKILVRLMVTLKGNI